jgi:hypothetical protein
MVEMASRGTNGVITLEAWRQGGQVAGHKVTAPRIQCSKQSGESFWRESEEVERIPVEPDAVFTIRIGGPPEDTRKLHFCYEADRGSMTTTDMLKKFRGYFHFVKKQQRHREAFGVHPIRAVLVETTDETRGRKLMEMVNHPLVAGPSRRSGLFWFTISQLFAEPDDESRAPICLERPGVIFDKIWALPDRTLHALTHFENCTPTDRLRV